MRFSKPGYFVSALVILAAALIVLGIYHSISLGTVKTDLASALKEKEQIQRELSAINVKQSSSDFDSLINVVYKEKAPSYFAIYINEKNEYSLTVEYDYGSVKKEYTIHRKKSVSELITSFTDLFN